MLDSARREIQRIGARPRNVHTKHLIVGNCRNLRGKPGLLRVQIAVRLFNHTTAGENKGPGGDKGDKLPLIAADEKQNRQHQLRANRKGIDVIDADIALDLKIKGLTDRLAAHVDVVVQPALLNQLIFHFPCKSPHTLTREIEQELHAQHEIVTDHRSPALVPYKKIILCDVRHFISSCRPVLQAARGLSQLENTFFLRLAL